MKFQLNFTKTAMINVSHLLHPSKNRCLSSSLCSMDHCRIQYVVLKITCIDVLGLALLNTISFLFNQIDQHNAAAPSKIWFLSFRLKPCSQEPNILAKLVEGWIPYVIYVGSLVGLEGVNRPVKTNTQTLIKFILRHHRSRGRHCRTAALPG